MVKLRAARAETNAGLKMEVRKGQVGSAGSEYAPAVFGV